MTLAEQEKEQREYKNVPQELHDLWELADDEERADMLLQYHGCLNRRAGCLSERQLSRIINRNELTNCEELIRISRAEAVDYIDDDIAKLFKLARLTDSQQTIWRLHMLGATQQESANDLGVSHQYVCQCLKSVRRKLSIAMIAYPWFGWYAVYLSEVRRK